MPRVVYLIVYHTGSKGAAAHWALYVPSAANENVGKVIHVTGSPLHGYTRQFRCNYDLGKTKSYYECISLGAVSPNGVRDVTKYSDNKTSVDNPTTYTDNLEKVALQVPAPGRLAGFNPLRGTTPGNGDCQYWLDQYVRALVAEGILESSAVDALRNAPRTVNKKKK
ncbi:hypothetical protein TWF481_002181 [Arthrobotrys musiformis]|uniref:Uncharacterized protein n=1 Tax=Arthrobotrys musiformis TaxID=47236 RepID=A0AAV9VTN6_9PEZI